MSTVGLLQSPPQPGVLRLDVGQPSGDLLAGELYLEHLTAAAERYGQIVFGYGADPGPLPALDAFAAWSREQEDGSFTSSQIMVTAGASQALDLLAVELGHNTHADCVLVQPATYPLALELFRHHQLEPIAFGDDESVPDPEIFVSTVRRLRSQGRRIAFSYVQPTFHNPTGRSWPELIKREFLSASAELELTVVEDAPYSALYFADRPGPSLAALSAGEGVIGIRTLSKIVAPALRLGWMIADRELVGRLSAAPLFKSGGGIAHLQALAASSFLSSAQFTNHLEQLRQAYRDRREALISGLEAAGTEAEWECPQGGLFLWLRLHDGLLADEISDRAFATGVRVLPGSHCGVYQAFPSHLRLAFSAESPANLARAAQLIARALKGGRYA